MLHVNIMGYSTCNELYLWHCESTIFVYSVKLRVNYWMRCNNAYTKLDSEFNMQCGDSEYVEVTVDKLPINVLQVCSTLICLHLAIISASGSLNYD
jgi:hypothetical protein